MGYVSTRVAKDHDELSTKREIKLRKYVVTVILYNCDFICQNSQRRVEIQASHLGKRFHIHGRKQISVDSPPTIFRDKSSLSMISDLLFLADVTSGLVQWEMYC